MVPSLPPINPEPRMPTRMLLFPLLDLGGPSSLPLIVLLFPFLFKDVVPDDVPGVVNANEEQEQRRSAHHEQGRAWIAVSRACRPGKHGVRREWEQDMKQPVLEYGLVG